MTRCLTERAPAKVNLTLHVLGRRADGYHDLDSLVAFSGFGDGLRLVLGPELALAVEGPTAAAAGEGNDNLVLRAARALLSRREGLRAGTFQLVKRLPVAAGIGGGSSDAAAALRLLARANAIALDDPVVIAAARATGSDVPVCLMPRARRMAGAGERVGAPLNLPALFAVLVNPRVAVSTPSIFAELALPLGASIAGAAHPPVAAGPSPAALMDLLARSRNDLQVAAVRHAPVIGEALGLLQADPACRLARMSGSGATVFGLFDSHGDAARAARALSRERPAWWVKPVVLR